MKTEELIDIFDNMPFDTPTVMEVTDSQAVILRCRATNTCNRISMVKHGRGNITTRTVTKYPSSGASTADMLMSMPFNAPEIYNHTTKDKPSTIKQVTWLLMDANPVVFAVRSIDPTSVQITRCNPTVSPTIFAGRRGKRRSKHPLYNLPVGKSVQAPTLNNLTFDFVTGMYDWDYGPIKFAAENDGEFYKLTRVE